MLTCPACDTPNEDGSLSCERCNCALLEDNAGETILSNNPVLDQQTVAATSAFSNLSGAASARARSDATELPMGRVLIGRYEIVERLGQGGMGTVYRVIDHELDRTIALKTIRPDLASNAGALRRLKQETLLARQIAHRNVIRVFDIGVADGLRFITMEFVEGQDLKGLLDVRKKLPIDEAVEILLQICQGLSAAHAEDVIHRDLKPPNILISPGNRVRIVDFGLARTFENSGITHSGVILGTPAYMSPEQALGQAGDVRSDLFSFGVIAFEVLTGELPFPSGSLSESLVSRTRGRARSIEAIDPEMPAWLARIVMRCLERNASDRYATAQEIVDDLTARDVCAYVAPDLSSGALAPGTMLGSRYRIEAEAGEGGMGRVYRATDLDLHRTVALKVVRPDLARNTDTLEQLMQEISLASQISHKNVLRIHDLGEASGLRFVSMAWAEGEDLGQLLKRDGPLPEERIIELAIEMCEGLQAAHEQGISHRDLKPSNILLTSGGHACIADFGLAHYLDPQSASATERPEISSVSDGLSASSAGTPRYMSPEQVDGVCIDHRTDIYSLGLMLYEMATGRIPFKDDSVFQTMTQRLTETPLSPKLINPVLSDQLTGVILRCLERDPNKRYATVQDLLTDLRGKPRPAQALLEEARPTPNRLRRIWLLAGIAALVLLAAGAWFRSRDRNRTEPRSDEKYVAVIPFRALGSDPNLKYRAEGIADAISARLSSLTSVHPVSPYALERVDFAQSDDKIAKEIGANLLIKGTVQSENDRLKVDILIYNTELRRVISNKSYPGVVGDLFALEDEIANDTEHALKIKPTLEERERQAPAPTQNLAAYDLYLKGRDILKKRRDAASAKEALGLFEQALKQDEFFALAWTGVADASLLLYRIENEPSYAERALSAANEARSHNDKLPEVHFTLGSLYSATGKYAEAVEEIKHALQLAPNSDNGYIRLAKAYYATGQTDQEVAALKKAADLNPYYWYNHKQLGVGYMDAGRYDDALNEFKEQIKENPTDSSAYNNIASIYLYQGRWKDGIAASEKAIQIQPSPDAYANLATSYFMLGRYSDAIPVYEKALGMSPNRASVIRDLAEAYTRAGQKDKGLQLYTRAISLLYEQLQVNSQDASALGELAMCYVGRGDLPQARVLIARARAVNPSDSNLLYQAAVVESASGHIPQALESLKSALQKGYSLASCLSDPDLKAVRQSPGFEALQKEFNHTAARRRL